MGAGRSKHSENAAKTSFLAPTQNGQYTRQSSACTIKPPQPFTDQAEFMKKWFSWKKELLKFLAQTKTDKSKWGNMLLNYIGPVGQEIHRTFTFVVPTHKDNIDELLKYFDNYYVFSTKTRKPNETVYQYVNDLTLMAEAKGVGNEKEYVMKKLMMEIPIQLFEKEAKTLMPTFVLSSNLKNLTLPEIAFIWELCEKNNACKQCGFNHGLKTCRAQGKQCHKCNNWNHLANVCLLNLIENCNYCGGTHHRGRCPSFNKVCSKCKRLNHFSWKCQNHIIQNCNYCGQDHIRSRSSCMANETVCTNCQRKGHISAKCNQRPRRRRY